MKIIKRVNDNQYKVGTFNVIQLDEQWMVSENNKCIALFMDLYDALAWSNLHYTCGHLVSEGVKNILTLIILDEEQGE